MNDLISIIIVNWNGVKWLQKCFDSLALQTHKHFEVIFVDNASTDDSVEFVQKKYPWVGVVKNDTNAGFAGGNILGLKHAKGNYILLLNNDVWVTEHYLEEFMKAFEEIPSAASIQSKIILMNDTERLDVCGSYWTDSCFLYHYGFGQYQGLEKYNKPMPFFSNKGSSMMIKKEMIDRVGFFDEDFWSYYEETDLCNRIWLAGGECWYWPKAVMYHAMGGTSLKFDNSFIQFHNFKNKLLSFLKNYEIITLLTVAPGFLLLNVPLSFFWLMQGKWRHFLALYKAIGWNVVYLGTTLKKRKLVQALRKKSDAEISKQVKKNPSLSYYYYLLTNPKKYRD